ncbi:hemagglutinin repeat-containing protein, partial [Polaromonas aquatica]
QGNLRLAAGNDLNAKAANVQAGGALTATAGNSVNITAGQSTSSFSWGMTTSESDLFSATSTKERKTSEQANAVGSSFGGNTVTIASGQDIHVLGSSVISDTGTTLEAGRNLTLEAAQNTSSSTSFYEKKESGLLDSGGAGITIGSREQSTDQKNRSTSAAASTVGSIGGNVTLIAGEQYRQVGSDVLAPNGDITIVAKKVDIVEARETSRTDIEQKFKQSGITVAISNPVLSAMQNAEGMAQAIGNTSDSRMQALGAAAIGLNGYNTYNSLTDKAGNFDADKAQGVSVSISLGSSKSQSNSTNQSDTARGSTVAAGNNVSITATGAGADSNLTVQGSSVTAGNNAILAADNQVKLLAAQNTASQSSTNSSSSGS